MEVQSAIVPEKRREGGGVHFEAGIHPNTESGEAAIYNDLSQGNLDAHSWNKEVGERIASYAYEAPALLLTIDGLEPVPPRSHALFTPLQEAGIVWKGLPARPNKLNHTGKVHVVKGDNLFHYIPQVILPDLKDPANLYPQMDAQVQSEVENAKQAYDTAIVGESALIASLGLILWRASKLMTRSVANQKMPRREFIGKTLKLAARTMGAGVAGSLLRYELPNIAASTVNSPTEEFLQTVDNVIRPRLTRSTFIDGRTALLLAKAEDAQVTSTDLSPATNVVVMGSQHLDMAPVYLQDKGERNKAIATFVQELLDVTKQVYGVYYRVSPEQISPQAVNSLLNYVTQIDIVEVVDPGGSSFQPNVAHAIDKQVIPHKSFHSPQVEEAISLFIFPPLPRLYY